VSQAPTSVEAVSPAPAQQGLRPWWRGWGSREAPNNGLVTSSRLPSAAGVQNRLFPKTRSWFALGAPLELLSPLSVARALVAFNAVVWLSAGIAWARLGLAPPVVAGAGSAVGWAMLLRAQALDERESALVFTGSTASGGLFLLTSQGEVAVLGFSALVLPALVATALFHGKRTVVAPQLLACAFVLGAGLPFGVAVALAGTALWQAAAASTAAAVSLVVRTVSRQGRTDADTGLPNGFGLSELVREQRRWPSFLVASIFLEGVGYAREALGYTTGTELVRRAAEDIGQVLPAGTLIGRVVADELVVVRELGAGPASDGEPVASALHEAHSVAQQLIRAVAQGRYLAGGIELTLAARVGIAIAPWDGMDVEQLVRRASIDALRAPRNSTSFTARARPSSSLTADDLALLADLRLAATRGELALHYQPKISLDSGAPAGVEALLRWSSPTRGKVPTDRFILLAERTGLIDRLTDWALAEALDAQLRWRSLGLQLPVAVNISAKSLTRPDFTEAVLAQLTSRGLPVEVLCLEVTETAQPDDLHQAVEALRPLRDMGARVSIDDFGAGYTSLSVLLGLAVDEVKVDRAFVMRSATSALDEAVVRAIPELSKRLGLKVLAEGVEDERSAALVRESGYDLAQGYYFARPLPEEALIEFAIAALPTLARGSPSAPEAARLSASCCTPASHLETPDGAGDGDVERAHPGVPSLLGHGHPDHGVAALPGKPRQAPAL
jgi:EAL domain-containing protein (putative c-di-GMP-specific phosphodiesterase class I)/GGDEF domain-containing protein